MAMNNSLSVNHLAPGRLTKRFPGGKRQKDGPDPHFPRGREQVCPGRMFGLHLAPFLNADDRPQLANGRKPSHSSFTQRMSRCSG